MNQQQNYYDIAVIGAGPVGIEAAVRFKRKGFSVVVIEKKGIVNTIYNFPKNTRFVRTKQEMQILDIEYEAKTDCPTKEEALAYYYKVVDDAELEVRTFTALKHIGHYSWYSYGHYQLTLEAMGCKEGYSELDYIGARYIIVATGACQNLKPFPIEDYSTKNGVIRDFEDGLPYMGKKCVVVGGGNSAVDVALELDGVGCEVSLLLRGEDFKPNVPEFKHNLISKSQVEVRYGWSVLKLLDSKVIIGSESAGYSDEIDCDFVFPMIGYQIDWRFLKSLGLDAGYDFAANGFMVHCDQDTMQADGKTNIFIAGAVEGSMDGGIPRFKKGLDKIERAILELEKERMKVEISLIGKIL